MTSRVYFVSSSTSAGVRLAVGMGGRTVLEQAVLAYIHLDSSSFWRRSMGV